MSRDEYGRIKPSQPWPWPPERPTLDDCAASKRNWLNSHPPETTDWNPNDQQRVSNQLAQANWVPGEYIQIRAADFFILRWKDRFLGISIGLLAATLCFLIFMPQIWRVFL